MELKGARVLIVEDEELISLLLGEMIETMGGRVACEAASLAEAERLASDCDCDLAILDVNLNGDLSYPAAQRLRERGVPFFFVTGYAPGAIPPDLAGVPVVEKPYTMSALVRATDRLVAGAATVAGTFA